VIYGQDLRCGFCVGNLAELDCAAGFVYTYLSVAEAPRWYTYFICYLHKDVIEATPYYSAIIQFKFVNR